MNNINQCPESFLSRMDTKCFECTGHIAEFSDQLSPILKVKINIVLCMHYCYFLFAVVRATLCVRI